MSGTTPHDPQNVPDEAFDRLRAADPVKGQEADLDRLRAAVEARIATQDATAPPVAAAGAAGAAPADELAARRSRTRWFRTAAVAASALVVGSAGFGVGTMSVARPAGDVITLAQGRPVATTGEGLPSQADLAGSLEAASGITDESLSMIYPYPQWRVVFTADGLSDARGVARAWALDAEHVFSAATAERAARVFGLRGEAEWRFGAWTVGDGYGPTVSLQADGLASLSFYDPTRDPFRCFRGEPGIVDDEGIAAPCEPADADAAESRPAPRAAEAAEWMRGVLADLGITSEVEIVTSEYDVPEVGGPRRTSVTAYQVIERQRTGLSWSATFVGSGTQSFYGPLATLVDLGTYDVVSENEAVDRLGDPRFTTWNWPLVLAEDLAATTGQPVGDAVTSGLSPEGTDVIEIAPVDPDDEAVVTRPIPGPVQEPTEPPTPPEPGDPFPWPVTEVTITKARLGMAMQHLPNGAVALLPAYELSADDRQGTWSVVAVADGGLDFTPRTADSR